VVGSCDTKLIGSIRNFLKVDHLEVLDWVKENTRDTTLELEDQRWMMMVVGSSALMLTLKMMP